MPEEVRLTERVDAVFRVTLPKLRLVVLRVSAGRAAARLMVKVLVAPPAAAVRTADWAVTTEETVAEKLAVLAPAGTVTDAGTVTALLLLDRVTVLPVPLAADASATVQASVAEPVIEVWLHDRELSAGLLEPDPA